MTNTTTTGASGPWTSFSCPHMTASGNVTAMRCYQCDPPQKVVLRVEYFVETNEVEAERLTDTLANGIVAAADRVRALANGGVRPMSRFELRMHEGMGDPEYRAGVAEAEAELALVRGNRLGWWKYVFSEMWRLLRGRVA